MGDTELPTMTVEPSNDNKSSFNTCEANDANDSLHVDPMEPVRNTGSRPSCFKNTLQEVLFVLTATMTVGLASMLSGIVTVASTFIGRSLHMTTAEITWLSSATTLSSGAFLLFFGRVADLFGRKIMLVGSLFLFAVFCLAAGFAKEAITLDVLNGVLGILSASAVPPVVGILGNVYSEPSRRKNIAFATFSGGNPLGFVFGTIFGGIATDILGWRASYYLLAIIALVFTIIAVFSVPKDFTAKEPLTWQTLKRFDIVGTILTVVGIGMLTAALSLGDYAPHGWKTGYVLAFIIIGIVLVVAFPFWENRFQWPLMPMSIWKDRNFTLVMIILSLGFGAFAPASFFLSLYFQNVKHMSALLVAVHLLPMAINGMAVNAFAGWTLHRIPNKRLMWVGAGSYAIALLLFALNTMHASYWAFCFPGLMLLVVGADLEFNVAGVYVISSMAPEYQSTAGSIFQTMTKLSQTIGLGLSTAVFNAVQKKPTLSNFWDKESQSYAAVFWACFVMTGLGVCLVPFLTLGTQGARQASVVASIKEQIEMVRVDKNGRTGEDATQKIRR